jgi:hypothetical protein
VRQILRRWSLVGERGWQGDEHSSASDGGVPQQQRVNHDISIGELGPAARESAPEYRFARQ